MTHKDEYPEQVAAATAFLRERLTTQPVVGIILGTGLGRVIDHMDVRDTISYDEIPNFPVSTVESHHGRLLVGTVNGVEVLAMQGRFHLYEGYSAKTATFPVRVMGELGIRRLLVTNAAGGMNPQFRRGDLMMITD
ncbi:MAG: purine-nucleoside phosphorylase, partial [Bacteroidetes bacterium]|nr:purine-nucleoside phosphorylase [Bacteroidota bacterium]